MIERFFAHIEINKTKKRSHSDPIYSVFSGSIAGSMSVLVCHPLDVIRTRMQTSSMNHNIHSSKSSTVFSLTGLYRGLLPPLCAQAVYKAVIFGTNNISNTYFISKVGERSHGSIFLSGFIAGTVVSFVVAPVELIRTQQIMNSMSISTMMLSPSYHNKPWMLWRYILPTILRDGPGVGCYFLVFEAMKSILSKFQTTSIRHHDVHINFRILAACFAGISFWVWALPFDTIKTVLEAEPIHSLKKTSFLSVASNYMSAYGIRKFYHAWPVAFGRGIPSAAVSLTTYDIIMDILHADNNV